MSIRTFAAIDVGSFELSMKIFEFAGKNKMREIDTLTKRIALGSDTYASGKISNEKIDELCHTLQEFASVMKAYKVESYKAYGTSAIRETENYAIVLDKIAQRTGIRIDILSNSEQRFLDYKSVASKGEALRKILEEKTAILDIGGGSIQISLFDNDTLVSTQNIRIGVLRIQERLQHLNAGNADMEHLVDEMVTAQLATYKKLYLKDREITNLIVIDDYLSPCALKMKKNLQVEAGADTGSAIFISDFAKLQDQLRMHSYFQIAQSMDMPENKVPLLVISSILTSRVAQLMGAESIWTPGVTLCDGIAYEYAEAAKLITQQHDFERDIVACATNISKRYQGSKKRGETLLQITGTIFDSMKKVHGMGKRERLYLEIAAILHDCGKYISLTNIGERSYDIIMATEIIGLSHREREIVANVVRFNHSDFIYFGQQVANVSALDHDSYLIVAKLTAILRLANSLDRSHKQKMKAVKASLNGNDLQLQVNTAENIMLEQSFFAESAEFFEEVYSVRPVLHQVKNK